MEHSHACSRQSCVLGTAQVDDPFRTCNNKPIPLAAAGVVESCKTDFRRPHLVLGELGDSSGEVLDPEQRGDW